MDTEDKKIETSVEAEIDKESETHHEVKTAKAGKKSAKAIKENEELKAKKEKKESGNEVTVKSVKPKTRSILERRGKKYKEICKNCDRDKMYEPEEAAKILPTISTSKFVGSAELHLKLNVDPKQADQNIRGTVGLPHGTGKTVRVAVFASADKAKDAKTAGADLAGEEEITAELDKGIINFDVLISTPENMAKLAKYARLLGPKGLMPNPKLGTVAADVTKATKESKAGKVEYRVDSTGIIHLGFGKLNFSHAHLAENLQAVIAAIKEARPASVKNNYIKTAFLSPTMGPSIKIKID